MLAYVDAAGSVDDLKTKITASIGYDRDTMSLEALADQNTALTAALTTAQSDIAILKDTDSLKP